MTFHKVENGFCRQYFLSALEFSGIFTKVVKILNQFIDKLNLPWKFKIDNKFQISGGN